ncbi:30S ribosomal protein S6e [Candidatus Woesearchaeota archaeon]|nr:30S ribosomal protein S6e [Candidatus Woesearchaeota archaeon]
MAIKLNVGDAKSKKTYTFEVSDDNEKQLFGKKIGDKFKGDIFDKAGYELEITGGSDDAGFPMRHDVSGSRRRKLLITKSLGNQNNRKGMRIRKTVTGNTIGDTIAQVNCKVVKHGSKSLEAPAEEPKEEAPAKESPKEEAPKEKPAEKPKEEKPADDKKAE